VLASAAAALKAGGADAIGVRCDVTDPKSVAALAERALSQFGAVHVVCNNAGVAGAGSAPSSWAAPLEDWKWVIDVNLWGVIHGVRSFMPILAQQDEAHVVNTASMAGLVPGGGIYGVTKHAVVALSESLYRECQLLAPRVGVSVLCPGWVNTRIMESERNRPEGPRPTPDAAFAAQRDAMLKLVDGLIKGGLDPRRVGEIVVAAMRSGRFYVLTHPWQHMVRERMEAILADGPPAEVSPPPGEGLPRLEPAKPG
jgi:NAD(P)-dependent dehydrogenase (short-subunit alcohol dehydrogenase family)